MSNALAVGAADFEQDVLKSPIPVLVDFWATWCGPCRAIAPTIDEIASEYAGKIAVRKVDVDREQELSEKYNVLSIPTLLLFVDGKVVDQVIGALPKRNIAAKLDAVLQAAAAG